MSNAKKGEKNHFYNKKHSNTTKLKISKANKGRKRTKEMINNMKVIHSGENNSMYNKQHSEKSKEKMRQKAIGRKQSKETKEKIKDALYLSNKRKLSLSESQIIEIYNRVNNGEKGSQLSLEYKVSRDIISRIKNKIGIYGLIVDEAKNAIN